jgi:hypothetical protein
MALVFEMGQEETNDFWRKAFDLQLIDRLASLLGRKRKKQGQGVAVARLGVARQVEVGDDVLEEEPPYPGRDEVLVGHG